MRIQLRQQRLDRALIEPAIGVHDQHAGGPRRGDPLVDATCEADVVRIPQEPDGRRELGRNDLAAVARGVVDDHRFPRRAAHRVDN
jgi:hypothetical protein